MRELDSQRKCVGLYVVCLDIVGSRVSGLGLVCFDSGLEMGGDHI